MNQIRELTAKLETASGTEKAELLNELGLLIHCSEPEKAESFCLQALELSRQTGRPAIGARSHFVIGIIYYMRGLYDRALENYGKALEMYEHCSEQEGLAATFRRIGLIYWNKLNFNDALNYYLKATSIREALSDKSGIAESYSDIAFVHWNRKEHDKALSYMEKSLALYNELGDAHHVSIAYTRIGVILAGNGEYEKSLESHFTARKIREELGDIASVYMAGILCGIGEAYKCLKKHDKAVESYDQAYKIGQRIDYKEIMIVADSNVGDAYVQSDRPELALPRLKRAYRLSREIGLRPRELASCCLIATSYEKLGRHKDALRYHKIYANLQEILFDEQKNRQIAEMQARFESEQSRKEAEIYRLKNVDLLREITERKRAEDELTKYKDHLEELVRERTAELEKALEEVERLKNQLQAENIYLREEIRLEHNFEEIIGRSEKLNRVLLKVERVASTNSTVLITGETGTGKELIARAIHSISKRKDRPLVKVNCAALPVNLIESELFGHEKGAFSGAVSRKIGRFELANGGTILLDEISELTLESQAKLLRVLQEGELERLGSVKSIKVDVRVIAVTNRNLEQQVKEGKFRDDLFYRLNVFPIELPPLCERREDIPILAAYFTEKESRAMGKEIRRIPQHIIAEFLAYKWPGNIRELKNIIERSIVTSQSKNLELDAVFLEKIEMTVPEGLTTLNETEKAHIIRVLESTDWRVSGPKGAARILGLNPNTLVSKMRKLGIKRGISEN
jgi:formate hydrogenlyase transcriptional activator